MLSLRFVLCKLYCSDVLGIINKFVIEFRKETSDGEKSHLPEHLFQNYLPTVLALQIK